MKFLKKGMLIIAIGLFSSSAFAAIKVGIIDMQELFSKSPQTKAAEQKIVSEFKDREGSVLAKRKDLETKLEKYKTDQAILSGKEKLSAEREITKLRQDFQRLASEFEVDMRVRRSEELTAFDKIFKDAVAYVAKKERFDLILPSNMVIYSGDKIDVTDDVLKVLKKRFKKS